ncbi:MAG: Stp1/IreP family PP2C-type Ser/Thr phosphatase [Betaproteobacteria bacterium]|nr:MAG: Stp1/IreP family PP2C-type Ser/Thr phosphatase [Betaproteobacteria bacterium]
MSLLKAKAAPKPKKDEARGWAFAGLSDVGRTRAHNEDCISVKDDLQLVVLADGMGGYQAGEVASKIAVDVVVAEITESKLTEKDIARIDPDTGISIAMRRLRGAIEKANNRICSVARDREELDGMGTTIVAACFYDGRVGVAHVGDSRCYRLRDGLLDQLTRDHSLVQDQLEKGLISAEEASHSPQKNLITRALGIDALAEADTQEFRTRAGDRYLLCSDGLSDMVEVGVIRDMLAQYPKPEEASKHLVDAANKAGGRDNISVIVVNVGETAGGDLWWKQFLKKPGAAPAKKPA